LFFIIGFTAFAASLLTLFSGFGLGTLLLPVFSLFFPVEVAVALTGIVHLSNNLFKISLVGRHADRGLLWRFGLPSVAGGLAGAWLLSNMTRSVLLHTWQWQGHTFEITLLKVVMATLMLFFVGMELIPVLKNLSFPRSWMTIGGLLSGFFGGLSGHQGALRSAFLSRCGLGKEAFIGTGVAIACLVDVARIPVYIRRFVAEEAVTAWSVLVTATLCAFAGAWLGVRYLKKVTLPFVQYCTAILITAIALLLGIGLL
jgi:uncharacterized protein